MKVEMPFGVWIMTMMFAGLCSLVFIVNTLISNIVINADYFFYLIGFSFIIIIALGSSCIITE